jgi:hypothetical protein
MSTDADWRERYLEKERDANEANAKLSEERAAHAAAVAQLEEARGRLNSMERGRPAEASSPADVPAGPGVGAEVDRMRKGGLDVHETADGNIAIVLPADITFGSGSKELTPAGRKSIDQVVRGPDQEVELQGQLGARLRARSLGPALPHEQRHRGGAPHGRDPWRDASGRQQQVRQGQGPQPPRRDRRHRPARHGHGQIAGGAPTPRLRHSGSGGAPIQSPIIHFAHSNPTLRPPEPLEPRIERGRLNGRPRSIP